MFRPLQPRLARSRNSAPAFPRRFLLGRPLPGPWCTSRVAELRSHSLTAPAFSRVDSAQAHGAKPICEVKPPRRRIRIAAHVMPRFMGERVRGHKLELTEMRPPPMPVLWFSLPSLGWVGWAEHARPKGHALVVGRQAGPLLPFLGNWPVARMLRPLGAPRQ